MKVFPLVFLRSHTIFQINCVFYDERTILILMDSFYFLNFFLFIFIFSKHWENCIWWCKMIVWRVYPSFYSLIVCHASFVTWVWAFTRSKIPSQHPWPQKGFFFHWIIQTSQLLIITLSSSTLFRVKQFLIKNSLWFPWSIENFFPTSI